MENEKKRGPDFSPVHLRKDSMQPQNSMPKPNEIWAIFIRRRWYFILPVIVVLAIGSVLVVKLPKKYTASTTIMVQPQKLPEEYVRPVINEDSGTRTNAITEQIMSRTNLERIIARFKLFEEPGDTHMFLEDKINELRKRITVEVTGNDRGGRNREASTFRLAHTGTDPVIVRDVTNALAANFIDEDLKTREAYAAGTSSFLEEELRVMEGRLKERETELRIFREKNRGGLPEQLEANLSQIERIQERLIEAQNNLYQAENQLMQLERQRSQSELVVDAPAGTAEGQADGRARPRDNRVLLEQLKAQYNDFASRYTEQHPDMIRLANRIRDLEALIARGQTDTGGAAPSAGPSAQALQTARNFDQIHTQQIGDTQVRIRMLNNEIGNLKSELAVYQKRVDDTPKSEEALLSLQRDYDNINSLYNSLLNRKLEAEIAVNMEKKQKGEQFRIVDPAVLPQRPSSPDMNKLFLMVMAAAFGGGAGLVFLLEYLDASIRKPEQIEALAGLPVLATVPSLQHPSQILKNRIANVAYGFVVVLVVGLMGCFAGLSLLGVGKFLELLRKVVPVV